MGLIYIKTWQELKAEYNIVDDSYSGEVLSHKTLNGNYNKATHGRFAGTYVNAEVDTDGYAKYDGMWFARWTYLRPGEKESVIQDEVPNIYDAFQAWENSIERRKRLAYEKVKESFRKAYPRDYREEN